MNGIRGDDIERLFGRRQKVTRVIHHDPCLWIFQDLLQGQNLTTFMRKQMQTARRPSASSDN